MSRSRPRRASRLGGASRPRRGGPPAVLVVVQNLALPGDRRVWLECQALRDAGLEVAAITPMAPGGDPAYACVDGVHLYKYPAPPPSSGVASFVREFAYCWLQTARLAATVWRRHRVTVFQACNPPDTFWLLALLLRPFGVRFVFDQHDLCPEVYQSRFARPNRVLLGLLRLLERATYATADHVIATNDSYRDVALRRGGCEPEDVTVVRTGPDPQVMRAGSAHPALKQGRPSLACFLGVMGPQDGVHVLLDAADVLVNEWGRRDVTFAVLGGGDCWAELRAKRDVLGLAEYVHMPGRVSDEEMSAYFSTADVGLSPDPPGPLNDVSTMNKTMEYMAFGLPVLAFDLAETRVSADEAAEYVEEPTARAYAEALVKLLENDARRAAMGAAGRRRVEEVLAWQYQEPAYVQAIRRIATRTHHGEGFTP
ncbi:MAG: glycosyltransferase family 4 protein [Actinomycetes bacterium]